MSWDAIDLLNLNGCVIKDERGIPLATLYEEGRIVRVVREPACGLGMYFYILSYLNDLGVDAR